MAQFIKITNLIFLANPNRENQNPETIVINVNNIKEFSTENNKYTYEGKVCTIIRTLSSDWGYIVAESVEELQKRLG